MVDGFLDFPYIVESLSTQKPFQSVYIRQDYIDIYKNIEPYLNKPPYRILITGTPGIGKSMFAYYMIWKLMQDNIFKDHHFFF